MSDAEKWRFHPDLQCFVLELRYDYEQRIGIATLGNDQSCTDMSGCIKTFKAIDPEVRQIQTFAARGAKADVVYTRDNEGKWNAGYAKT